MHKTGQKCFKKSENQQNQAQKYLDSDFYLKIIMPGILDFKGTRSDLFNFSPNFLRFWYQQIAYFFSLPM